MSHKIKPLTWLYILGSILIPSLLLNAYLIVNRNTSNPNAVKVIGVIDGDTLVLEGKIKIRLRYVDAPELQYCGGNQAKEYLDKIVTGKSVRLENQIPDQYGRSMALVYQNNRLINEEMLASGWVRYHHDSLDISERMKSVIQTTQNEKRGIFGLCQSMENTDKPKCNIKGNIDKNSDTRKYYLPGCAQYKFTIVEKDLGEDFFCSEKEAQQARFTKAETCK